MLPVDIATGVLSVMKGNAQSATNNERITTCSCIIVSFVVLGGRTRWRIIG